MKAGTANKGMVAKLQACRAALQHGVGDVVIAGGRTVELDTLADARRRWPAYAGGAMKVTLDDIQRREVPARAADLPASAGGVRARQGPASL